MRLRRHPIEKNHRLRNILLVGSSEREEFLDYLDIKCTNKNKAKNYRWENRNLMNIPEGVTPRYETTHSTDIIIYFVDTTVPDNLKMLNEYFDTHIHVKHHIIVCSDFEEDFLKLKRSNFYKEINNNTDVDLFDNDYGDEELETFIKQITKKR